MLKIPLSHFIVLILFTIAPLKAATTTQLENEILQAVNKERQERQLDALRFNEKLLTISRQHSTEMATSNTLSHTLNGKTMASRVETIGYDYTQIAENVAMTGATMRTDLANTVVRMWMDSPGHRKNILTPELKETGIGVATASNGDTYFTMVFGSR